jgi:hypothetical protein
MRPLWWMLGIVAAVALVFGVGSRLFVSVPTVATVSFVNETTYAMTVDVSGADKDGWLPLGTAERSDTTRMSDVVDQGEEWVFRFRAQGRDGGEMHLTKDELTRSEWRVVIASSVGQRLAAQGAPPSPIRNKT